MSNYPNPCKSSIGEYTYDELYQIVVEELPKLRAIAEAAQAVRQFGKDDVAYDLPVENNLLPALKQWEDCIGSQLDARNG
jgi:hypothetical protein